MQGGLLPLKQGMAYEGFKIFPSMWGEKSDIREGEMSPSVSTMRFDLAWGNDGSQY